MRSTSLAAFLLLAFLSFLILACADEGDWSPTKPDPAAPALVDGGMPTSASSIEGGQNCPGKIAFYSTRDGNDEIYVMEADGSNQTNLTHHSASDRSPAWSPDGRQIAFSSNRDGNLEIYVMEADGSNLTKLTNHSGPDLSPAWSPDGTQIAFHSFRDGTIDIYAMDVDGSNLAMISEGSTSHSSNPAWSPDGTQIAFQSFRDGNNEIYIMDVHGWMPWTYHTRVTNSPYKDGSPAWSPDGAQIAFHSFHPYQNYGDAIMVSEDRGDWWLQTNLTGDSGSGLSPAWSPDGTQIAFHSFRDGNGEIYVMEADGSNQTNLTNQTGGDFEPAWSCTASANQAPVADVGGPYSGVEGIDVSFDGSASTDADADPLTYEWDFDYDATAFDVDATGASPSHSYPDNSTFTVALRVRDGIEPSEVATTLAEIANAAPSIGAITGAPMDPIPVTTEVSIAASFSDLGTADTHSGTIDWDANGTATKTPAVIIESNGSGSASGSYSYMEAGVYTVEATVTDDDGAAGASIHQYVTVFDPEAGFVTGGGWIDSPEGACLWSGCAQDGSTVGKATFGFVSKYKKGATTPSGNTQFRFSAGDLSFTSSTYDWLVISGPKAQYKGSGQINGTGDYGFMLAANDGEVNGGGGVDRFRIKIWDEASDEVVYDNQRGDADDADASTAITHGSIVIHNN